jgi:hypothetical protein
MRTCAAAGSVKGEAPNGSEQRPTPLGKAEIGTGCGAAAQPTQPTARNQVARRDHPFP